MLRIKIIQKSEKISFSDRLKSERIKNSGNTFFGGFDGDKAIIVSYADAKTFEFSSDLFKKLKNIKSKKNVANCCISTK